MMWPFQPVARDEKVIETGDPPARLEAPYLHQAGFDSLVVHWSGAFVDSAETGTSGGGEGGDDEARVQHQSSQSGKATAYELEVLEVNAMWGRQPPWRPAYKGKSNRGTEHTCRRISRGAIGLHARVRGSNKFGRSAWSDESALMRVDPLPPPDLEELREIPAAWVELDVAGLSEFKEEAEPAALKASKERLLQSLCEPHRTREPPPVHPLPLLHHFVPHLLFACSPMSCAHHRSDPVVRLLQMPIATRLRSRSGTMP